MVHITSLVMEKTQFNHFPIISLWELSVAMATKPRDRLAKLLAILKCPSPSNICIKLESHYFTSSGGVVIFFFSSMMLPWQLNKMATDHQRHKLGRHQLIITAKHKSLTSMVMEKILPFFHSKSIGAFCCCGNQTKRQITIILANLNCLNPSNICTKLDSYSFSGFKGVVT